MLRRRTDKNGDLERLAEWRTLSEGLRPQLVASTWRRGERNVASLAKALGVTRDTVYADLRDQGVDYRDRRAAVEEEALLDYGYVSERILDSMLAEMPVPVGVRAFVEGYDPRTRGGRCRLFESLLDQPSTDVAGLTRDTASLARGRLNVPELGQAAVWRGTVSEPDGRTVGLALFGLAEETEDGPALMLLMLGQRDRETAATEALTEDGVAVARSMRIYEENPRREQRPLDPERLQAGVGNLVGIVATLPTLPPHERQHCLYHTVGTVSGDWTWGDARVDEVRVGIPIWHYQRLG